MSKVSRDKKKAEAKAEANGKQAKIAKAKKAEKLAETKVEATPSKIKNYGFCCTCKRYVRKDGVAYPCKKSGKYTSRKSTCGSYICNA